MAHWYHPETGFLLDRVEYKDPKRKGQYREATLADARPLGYLPSVTTILQLLSRPGLTIWQMDQVAKAAWDMADSAYEIGWDNWHKDVIKQSKEYTEWTATFGTSTHWWLNKKLRAVETTEIPPMIAGSEECADGLLQWFTEQGFKWEYTERHFANLELGTAGTADLLGFRTSALFPAIGDAKTQEPPLTPHAPEYPLQLSGYCQGLGLPIETERWSFIVNRNDPTEVKGYLWCDKDSTIEATNARYDKIWLGLVSLWQGLNQYVPGVSNDG